MICYVMGGNNRKGKVAMKTRRIVHLIISGSLKWDLIEMRWVVWPKHIGCTGRYLHSAKRARKDFERLCRQPPCLRNVRWLTYESGRLRKVRTIGHMPYPIHPTVEVNHECLNPIGTWWKACLV